MESFDNISNQISSLTIWDIKEAYNKVKNVVMNYTEMESKVREATNNEPWGASSTLMQEIASGTFNFQYFNEIMPTIYRRFTEKEAKDWRQIYKALQLLEYLVKHGSERVVDDARSHLSAIKMLRNFHYVDEKAKDQGINVRNRAKELAELLSDLERVRQERRKAKANKSKYTGVGSDTGGFGGSGSSYSGYQGGTYPGSYGRNTYGGGGYGSGGTGSGAGSGFRDDDRNATYDEYDEDVTVQNNTTFTKPSKQKVEEKPKEPEIDLLALGDDTPTVPATTQSVTNKYNPTTSGTNAFDDEWGNFAAAGTTNTTSTEDDFDDFQAAPTTTLANTSSIKSTSANVFDVLGGNTPPTLTASAPTPTPLPGSSLMGNNGFNGTNILGSNNNISSSFMTPKPAIVQSPAMIPNTLMNSTMKPSISSTTTNNSNLSTSNLSKPSGVADFSDLWSVAASSTPAAKPQGNQNISNMSMSTLAAQKSSSAIWGSNPSTNSGNSAIKPSSNNGFSQNEDLLF